MKIVCYNTNMKIMFVAVILILLVSCSLPQEMDAQKTDTLIEVADTYTPNVKRSSAIIINSPNETVSPSPTPFERKNVMNSPKIVICKSERMLYVYDGDTLCAKIKIALGFAPEGHKLKEGDGKTPEGEYYICSRNDKSKYYLSLAISYPNTQDAKSALDSDLISEEEFTQIETAIKNGSRPPWDTSLGGEIMIHGSDVSTDWTAGCIAAVDSDIDYLWENCPIGTSVTILP